MEGLGGGGAKAGGAGGLPAKGVWEPNGVEGVEEEHGAHHFLDVGVDSRSFILVSLRPSVSLVALGVDAELSLG